MPPRRSRRVLPRVLQALTGVDPDKTPPLANKIQLTERLGDNRWHVQPAVRPRMGAGGRFNTAAVGRFGISQLRATINPLWVQRYRVSAAVFAHHWYVGPDRIESNRSTGPSWRFPADGGAIVESGDTAASMVGTEETAQAINDLLYDVPIYLEPGEVLAFVDVFPNQPMTSEFQWYEVPL